MVRRRDDELVGARGRDRPVVPAAGHVHARRLRRRHQRRPLRRRLPAAVGIGVIGRCADRPPRPGWWVRRAYHTLRSAAILSVAVLGGTGETPRRPVQHGCPDPYGLALYIRLSIRARDARSLRLVYGPTSTGYVVMLLHSMKEQSYVIGFRPRRLETIYPKLACIPVRQYTMTSRPSSYPEALHISRRSSCGFSEPSSLRKSFQ